MELEKISLDEWLSNPKTRPADYDVPEFRKRYDAYCDKHGLKDKKLNIDEFEEIADKVNENWGEEDWEEVDKDIQKELSTDKRSPGQYVADDIEREHIEKVFDDDEKDEMADFQKSLDDYAAKNKRGRDDIPVTTRR